MSKVEKPLSVAIPRLSVDDVKKWKSQFGSLANWSESIGKNTLKALDSDGISEFIFIVYRDTPKYFLSEAKVGQKILKSQYSSLLIFA
jgi:hypothetical protein